MLRRPSFVVAICTAVLLLSAGMAGAHPSKGDETESAGSLLVDPFDRSLILGAFGATDPATIAPTEGTTSIANLTPVGTPTGTARSTPTSRSGATSRTRACTAASASSTSRVPSRG
jgi:hypothetical protein